MTSTTVILILLPGAIGIISLLACLLTFDEHVFLLLFCLLIVRNHILTGVAFIIMIIHCQIQRFLESGILLQFILKRFTALMGIVFIERSIIIHFVRLDRKYYKE